MRSVCGQCMVGIRPLQHLGHSTSEDYSESSRGDLSMVDASVAGYMILAGGTGVWERLGNPGGRPSYWRRFQLGKKLKSKI